MSDLTERLAAKLKGIAAPYNNCGCADCLAEWLPVVLPLLLSEPELVAALSDEVRLSVLTPRERAGVRFTEAYLGREAAFSLRYTSEEAWDEYWAATRELDAALAEVRALTPEVGNAK